MVRKLKRYNRLKGLVGAILEYMEAPSPDKYEAIKGLGYKDVIIKMYTKAISVYLNYNDKYKGVTESLFNLVDELRKPNVTYNTASVKPPRTVDRQELKRVASTELERVIPIMYKHKNEGSKKVLELCKPSTYKDRTLTLYLQGVRYYCKYRRPYFKHNRAIPSIIDKIEAEEGISEPMYKKQIRNEKPKVSALVKYLLEHVDEDYRSCLSYAVNELGYSFLTARNYIYLFRKYLQYGTKMKDKRNNYTAFYHYMEQYAKDYKLPVREETLDNKRYKYLYKLTQMYMNKEPLDKLKATELQDLSIISLYCEKRLKTLRLTRKDYRDIDKIIKELKNNKIEKAPDRIPTEVINKEGNLDMIKKKPKSYGKPLTYEKYREIAEMMKEIILKDEVPLDRAYFMEKYNLTYSQVRKLYSSLRSYMKKHSIVSYRVAKAWIRAIKEVVEFPSSREKLKNVQTKNEIAEQEPTYNVEQEPTYNVEEDTTDIKAGVIWNGSCSILDNREQAIGFQKALKAFNVTDSRICRITIEDSYDYEAIDEE